VLLSIIKCRPQQVDISCEMRELEFPNCGFDWYVLVSATAYHGNHAHPQHGLNFVAGEMG
jgi:hypothetical protein